MEKEVNVRIAYRICKLFILIIGCQPTLPTKLLFICLKVTDHVIQIFIGKLFNLVNTMRCPALNCSVLHCPALHRCVLHCTTLHCTALHSTLLLSLHCTALHCTALGSAIVKAPKPPPSPPSRSMQILHKIWGGGPPPRKCAKYYEG